MVTAGKDAKEVDGWEAKDYQPNAKIGGIKAFGKEPEYAGNAQDQKNPTADFAEAARF